RLSAWWGGTTSARRGVQMGQICDHMKAWETLPPIHAPNLMHYSTHLMGDLNTSLSNERAMRSISTGASRNGFRKDQIKYPGQNRLFQHLNPITPENFVNIREEREEVDSDTGQVKIVK